VTQNRLFALLAFLCMASFFGVLLRFVPRVDLAVAVTIGLALSAYDLWTQLGPRRRR
jgi:prepilin signal peptidase PulO-like enzyme (type II secretory pathway)